MQKYLGLFLCAFILAGCGGASKSVKSSEFAPSASIKYNIGISESFGGDNEVLNITEMTVKELVNYRQVKFVDRRKLKSNITAQAAILAEGSSGTVKLEDPMQYILTGLIMRLGSKIIVKLSILSVQTSMTESSLTFEYEKEKDMQSEIKKAVAKLMQGFSEQNGK